MEYPFNKIERKWQEEWKKSKIFNCEIDKDKESYYVLSMFPYPSGALHMGHVSNYAISDAITRCKMMQGFNVMQPMGYDSFGMPAENFAIKHNSHPKITTEDNIKIMKDQFIKMGFGFDWEREISTCREDYYKWSQWLFLEMLDAGLAYKKKSFVNWCDDCKTVLANEQVEDGLCWRCDSVVEQKEMEQWFFKITEYAEELLDFSKVIDWPERVKTMQTNWIGKSFGTEINFKLENDNELIPVFTTRADTIFGVTYMALAPEHPLITQWLKDEDKNSEFYKFCYKVMNEDKIMRSSEDNSKEGFFTGRYCINPVNGEKIQIWVTNYVLMDYGTGAVMAVPTHDQRDFEFAKKYNLPMKVVIDNPEKKLDLNKMSKAYVEPGILINSDKFNGMISSEAKDDIAKWISDSSMGKLTVNYRLRDWGISRQRYWGAPIPVCNCENCGVVPIPISDLPVTLPSNVEIGKTKQNPLKSVKEFVEMKCPKCGADAKRETDTMDTFVDSSWYYLRYTDPKEMEKPFKKENVDYWMAVDQYIGGIEHACMHLLYARFINKFVRDRGQIVNDEPFLRLLTQGMVTKDGAKMSKSKGNVVSPQDYIDRYGADTIRVFMLFASPPEKDVEWSDEGVVGSFRFLNRVWRIFDENMSLIKNNKSEPSKICDINDNLKKLRYSTHYTIKKVNEDIENRMQFNTAIASIMQHLNMVYSMKNIDKLNMYEKYIFAESCIIIPRLLYPFAPHISEELWQSIGNEKMLHSVGVLNYNKKYLVKDEITYVVQVGGKVRGKLVVKPDISEEELKKMAIELENVKRFTENKEIRKIIIIPKKLISIVV